MPFEPFNLGGKVALITGGNGGIGLGIAEGLAQAGAAVEIWGTNPDKNQSAAEQLSAHGVPVSARRVDVADEDAVNTAMAALLAEHGRLDACFANAGIGARIQPFHEMTTYAWEEVMAINLRGKFLTLRAAAAHMVERAADGDSGGALVGISSTSAGRVVGSPSSTSGRVVGSAGSAGFCSTGVVGSPAHLAAVSAATASQPRM